MSNRPPDADTLHASRKLGAVQAICAFGIWGFMPVFFKIFDDLPAAEVVAHRIIWCVPLLLGILLLRGQMTHLRSVFSNPRATGWLFVSALLIAGNWGIYIWAVSHDHVVAASLGYFLNPLLNVLLGFLILKERLGRWQIVAIAIAALAVAILAMDAIDTLWISIGLAMTFGLYGLVRKIAPVESLPGLTVETMLLAPFAIGFALWFWLAGSASNPGTGWGSSAGMNMLLISAAVFTAIPLLLFGSATRKIDYSTIGFIQYIGPSIQFSFGVFWYKEPLSATQIGCFMLIWSALALFSWDALQRYKQRGTAPQI